MNRLKLGIIGTGRIAKRFVKDAKVNKYIEVQSVFSRNALNVEEFRKENEIPHGLISFEEFLNSGVDIVYIASPHQTHYFYARECMKNGKHILCEKPATLNRDALDELFKVASENNVVFLEAIKTAFMPSFLKIIEQTNSGIIGNVMEVRATFTKLITDKNLREYDREFGGVTNELSVYPLLLAVKVLGKIDGFSFYPILENGVDIVNRIITIHKNNKIAISTVGMGMKQESCAIISGTKGYIYIPAPWWFSEVFYIRFEDVNQEIKITSKHIGNGFAYELSEFINLIRNKKKESHLLPQSEIKEINSVISMFNLRKSNQNEKNHNLWHF